MNTANAYLLDLLDSQGMLAASMLRQLRRQIEIGSLDEIALPDYLLELGVFDVGQLKAIVYSKLGLDWVLADDLLTLGRESLAQKYLELQQYQVFPLEESLEGLKVMLLDPYDCVKIDAISAALPGIKLLPCWASAEAITKGWDASLPKEGASKNSVKSQNVSQNIFEDILRLAVSQCASDIHYEFTTQGFTVRVRVDGTLKVLRFISVDESAALLSYIKLASGMDIAERRLPQDGRIIFREHAIDLDLRVSLIPSSDGESLVIRILQRMGYQSTLLDLGLSALQQKEVHGWMDSPDGLILVTGPTGSGKTTTLYSMLNLLDPSNRKMITVEDPVEYYLPGATQVAVNPSIGLDFSTALRSILRQAPDVILIGEIRDTPTARIAVNASITGHRVLSSLHTQNALGAIDRLMNMGVESFLLSSALRGVIAQRLVPLTCSSCLGEEPLVQECKHCYSQGYRGRTGIFDLLTIDARMSELIHQNTPIIVDA